MTVVVVAKKEELEEKNLLLLSCWRGSKDGRTDGPAGRRRRTCFSTAHFVGCRKPAPSNACVCVCAVAASVCPSAWLADILQVQDFFSLSLSLEEEEIEEEKSPLNVATRIAAETWSCWPKRIISWLRPTWVSLYTHVHTHAQRTKILWIGRSEASLPPFVSSLCLSVHRQSVSRKQVREKATTTSLSLRLMLMLLLLPQLRRKRLMRCSGLLLLPPPTNTQQSSEF